MDSINGISYYLNKKLDAIKHITATDSVTDLANT